MAAPPPGPCSLALLGSAADDTLLSNGSQDGTASLCCVETSLEDCSSVEPEAEGFAVYQSPLSLEAEGAGAGHACGGGCGGAAGAAEPLVLADLAQHPLACDPDLEEMLRWA